MIGTVAIATYLYVRRHPPQHPPSDTEARIKLLEQQVADQRQARVEAVEKYAPTVKWRIDDLDQPVVDLLRLLPGVEEVEILVPVAKPVHRVIHLCDWHHVSADLYAIDIRHAAAKSLTDAEVGLLYRRQLLEVELVQLEQEAILRCLANHHGLKRVLAEGVTRDGLATYLGPFPRRPRCPASLTTPPSVCL